MTETVPPGEADDIQAIVDLSLALLDQERRPVRRGQHPKHHGVVRAEFAVEPGLPPGLAVGLFAEPRVFQAWVRFSNGSVDDDRLGDVHGMVVKLLDVPGQKVLDGENDEATHDFVLMDNPAFFARTARSNRRLAERMLRSRSPSVLKSLLFWLPEKRRRSAFVLTHHFFLGLRFHEFRVLRAATSKTPADPLRVTYWSATPYRLGATAAKYKAVPRPGPPPAPPPADSPDLLRLAMAERLRAAGAVFDFSVTPYRDPSSTPVEDASVEWPDSAPVKVAEVRIPPQEFDTPEQMRFAENLSYTPWHALPEHRPLGGINRARRAAYVAVSEARHRINQAPRVEPGA